jgi:hypothetical protein
MSSLESNKNLAGIGSILLLFPVVSIVEIILLLLRNQRTIRVLQG